VTAKRFIISGRVQGVGFRWFAARLGTALGIRGTVRNLSDGRVEVVAAGPAHVLDQFGRELAKGPPGARVDGMETVHVEDEVAPTQGFEVVR
jgi:acylphosphatase